MLLRFKFLIRSFCVLSALFLHMYTPWWTPAVVGAPSGRCLSLHWSSGGLCYNRPSGLFHKHGWKLPLTAAGHMRRHVVSLERTHQDSALHPLEIHTVNRRKICKCKYNRTAQCQKQLQLLWFFRPWFDIIPYWSECFSSDLVIYVDDNIRSFIYIWSDDYDINGIGLEQTHYQMCFTSALFFNEEMWS